MVRDATGSLRFRWRLDLPLPTLRETWVRDGIEFVPRGSDQDIDRAIAASLRDCLAELVATHPHRALLDSDASPGAWAPCVDELCEQYLKRARALIDQRFSQAYLVEKNVVGHRLQLAHAGRLPPDSGGFTLTPKSPTNKAVFGGVPLRSPDAGLPLWWAPLPPRLRADVNLPSAAIRSGYPTFTVRLGRDARLAPHAMIISGRTARGLAGTALRTIKVERSVDPRAQGLADGVDLSRMDALGLVKIGADVDVGQRLSLLQTRDLPLGLGAGPDRSPRSEVCGQVVELRACRAEDAQQKTKRVSITIATEVFASVGSRLVLLTPDDAALHGSVVEARSDEPLLEPLTGREVDVLVSAAAVADTVRPSRPPLERFDHGALMLMDTPGDCRAEIRDIPQLITQSDTLFGALTAAGEWSSGRLEWGPSWRGAAGQDASWTIARRVQNHLAMLGLCMSIGPDGVQLSPVSRHQIARVAKTTWPTASLELRRVVGRLGQRERQRLRHFVCMDKLQALTGSPLPKGALGLPIVGLLCRYERDGFSPTRHAYLCTIRNLVRVVNTCHDRGVQPGTGRRLRGAIRRARKLSWEMAHAALQGRDKAPSLGKTAVLGHHGVPRGEARVSPDLWAHLTEGAPLAPTAKLLVVSRSGAARLMTPRLGDGRCCLVVRPETAEALAPRVAVSMMCTTPATLAAARAAVRGARQLPRLAPCWLDMARHAQWDPLQEQTCDSPAAALNHPTVRRLLGPLSTIAMPQSELSNA